MLCLLPEKINDFKQALRQKDIKVADLLNMDTETRTKLFEEYAGANAKDVNTLFEEKLLLKNRTLGLQNLIMKLGEFGKYDAKAIAENKQILSDFKAKQQERIFSPKENETFLNDVADKKLGVHITPEVAQKVFDLSQRVSSLKDVNPKMSGVSDEYLQAKNELNQYITSQKPQSVGASIGKNLSIIARNNLLLNPSTPLKTSIGQVVNSTMDYFTRRIGTMNIGANSELVSVANKEAWDTFKKTGDNTASMESVEDLGKLGEKHNFDLPGPGARSASPVLRGLETGVRKVAQASNKVAIDWEHNVPFTKFHQKAFFDMSNLMSTDIAKSEGLTGSTLKSRSADIFKDAAKITPETQEGAIVRSEAQKQAARVTSTNETLLGNLATSVKNYLNKVTPGFPIGDIIAPIAKIPANLISNGIENAGVGIPLGAKDIYQGRLKIQSADLATRYEGMAQMSNGIQKVARTVGVLSAAALFTSQLGPKDFKSDNYGNHFLKIGNTWINTEYISAISPALAGMMEVKQKSKSGQDALTTATQYSMGAAQGLKSLPVIDDVAQLRDSIANGKLLKYASDFFNSRGKPVFISNLLKNRPINRLFFGANGIESTEQVSQDARAAALAKKK